MTSSPPPEDQTTPPSSATPEDGVTQELLLFGNEEILRGSDNATLVAFAALAFQDLRGGEGVAQHAGSVFLLFSVLCCALVHFALGNAYIHRARSLLRPGGPRRRRRQRRSGEARTVSLGIVWLAVLTQMTCIALGLLLILPKQPPALLVRYLLPWFS
ncbi:hypothetical protein [Tautonia marina]|uniref:hypothetical protein n=1 Tax=Tautonia marina TaxID=2653855 RepID=UPI0012606B3C|nr:hypothetical protein [Tautonia marina]